MSRTPARARRRAALSLPIALALGLSTPPSVAAPSTDPAEAERRVDAVLARLSVAEKVGQLSQRGGDVNTGKVLEADREAVRQGRVGSLINVRGVANVNDAQRLALEGPAAKVPLLLGFDVIHGYRTVFPVPLGLAASWDPSAVQDASAAASAEASACGVRWAFSPMVDVARDPRWGRVVEGAGEDPYLGAAMARAQVRGLQGDDYAAPGRLAACVKHWVAYGAAQGGRDYNSAEVSERTLRSVYFPPFKAALDAGAATVMSALNDLDGVPGTADARTLTAVLRGEWKFAGPVVADYQAVDQLVAHGVAAGPADAARLALLAGVDMEEQSRAFEHNLPALVSSGAVPVEALDRAVRRVLRVKVRLGLFEAPYADPAGEAGALLSPAHLEAARRVAGRTLVLLKNDGGVLPLAPKVRSVAVVGPLADDRQTPMGPWFGDGRAGDVVTLLEAVRAKAAARRPALTVAHANGCDLTGQDGSGIAEAARLALTSDFAVVAVGEGSNQSGEATSLTSLDLTGRQLDLVRAVAATGTPTAVVLMNGRPLTLGAVDDLVPAILEAWYPGTQGAPAVADALFGDSNPGGKLPMTFPRSVGQIPMFYNHKNTGRPYAAGDKYTSKYIDSPTTPLYPFGHGLSYTHFELSGLRLSADTVPLGSGVSVSVEVRNAGDREGDEVVQIYLHDKVASVARPVRELCGFQRVTLKPGERRTVRIDIAPEALSFYDQAMEFRTEPGAFEVYAGTSSVGGLKAEFAVTPR